MWMFRLSETAGYPTPARVVATFRGGAQPMTGLAAAINPAGSRHATKPVAAIRLVTTDVPTRDVSSARERNP